MRSNTIIKKICLSIRKDDNVQEFDINKNKLSVYMYENPWVEEKGPLNWCC